MLDVLRFLTRRTLLTLADGLATSAVMRWSWTAGGVPTYSGLLPEFRPADPESVRDMMAGRYLLAGRLVETGGTSPFTIDSDSVEWWQNLHGFSWLRHFRDTRDAGERGFARTLVLDWIGREGAFEAHSWAIIVCAQRVLNWLRHFKLITDGATPEQIASISRSLASQVQSLKMRTRFSAEPLERLYAALGLVGAGICLEIEEEELGKRVEALRMLLIEHLDADGFYRDRNSRSQLQLLVELVTIRMGLARTHGILARELSAPIEAMHRALDAVTLGTGEPAYFNGTGQLPHDILIAVQAQSLTRNRQSGVVSGYGILVAEEGTLVADGGFVPDFPYARDAHASALGFEFSHGSELVVGSCGPAPDQLADSQDLFRKTSAHSAPTIDDQSCALIVEKGGLKGVLRPLGDPVLPLVDQAEMTLALTNNGYLKRFGAVLERRLTLLSGGRTLVGQDKLTIADQTAGEKGERAIIRFHLAPGARIGISGGQDLLRIRLASGSVWTFLWEGADMHEEESVRQSARLGFHRVPQIVLTAPVRDGHEIAWIFTLEQ